MLFLFGYMVVAHWYLAHRQYMGLKMSYLGTVKFKLQISFRRIQNKNKYKTYDNKIDMELSKNCIYFYYQTSHRAAKWLLREKQTDTQIKKTSTLTELQKKRKETTLENSEEVRGVVIIFCDKKFKRLFWSSFSNIFQHLLSKA